MVGQLEQVPELLVQNHDDASDDDSSCTDASSQSSPSTGSKCTPHGSGVDGQPISQLEPLSAIIGHKRRPRSSRCRNRGKKCSYAWKCFAARIQYSINQKILNGRFLGSLADRGANGCIIGRDMSIISRTEKYIDLTGIQEHTVNELNLVHAAGVVETQLGPVIAHVCQGAHMPDGKTILAPIQMEAHGCTVVDKARGLNAGIQPYIQTHEGYRFPLALRHSPGTQGRMGHIATCIPYKQ